ncbi:MAG TPA: c-type cytochrome [Magnetovibrio sp.]
MATALSLVAAAFVVTANPVSATAAEMESSIARGGLLYDSWFKVIGAQKPQETHKAWPASNTKKAGDVTWRCKSCHGWDLKGKDGAYATGSYQTGITGLTAYANAEPAKIIEIIKNDTHGMAGMMADQDYVDLANFVSKGQVDMAKYIDYGTKKVMGDVAKGEMYYNTVCAKCHGMDGTLPKEMEEVVGELANGNPWEILHKIMNGQPREAMPAMRAFGVQASADILAYSQSLPTSR